MAKIKFNAKKLGHNVKNVAVTTGKVLLTAGAALIGTELTILGAGMAVADIEAGAKFTKYLVSPEPVYTKKKGLFHKKQVSKINPITGSINPYTGSKTPLSKTVIKF